MPWHFLNEKSNKKCFDIQSMPPYLIYDKNYHTLINSGFTHLLFRFTLELYGK